MKRRLNKYLLLCAFIGFVAVSCHDAPSGDTFAEDIYVPIGALVSAANVETGFFDLGDISSSSIAFDLESAGEDVSNVDVMVSYNAGAVVPFKSSSVPGNVTATFSEVLAATGVAESNLVIGDNFQFLFDVTSASGTFRSSSTLNAAVSCSSALAGTYDYLTTQYFTYASCDGETDLAGQVTISEISIGVYGFDDWSVGTYDACYGGFGAWGSLTMSDICNKITVNGEDAFGDTWSFDGITTNGADWSFTYNNTYGEFGVTTLTRTDGSSWPPLKN